MAKEVKLSQTRSGGASEGRGYFKELVEIFMCAVYFTGRYFAMASAGIVMHIPMLCGMSPEQIRDLLKDLGGDRFQRMDPTKRKNLVRYAVWALGIRRKFYRDCEKTAKKHFTWEKLRSGGRLASHTKPLIAIVKFNDLKKIIRKDLLNGIMNGKIEGPIEAMTNGEPGPLAQLAPVHYFSDDGVYRWCYAANKLIKVTNKVTPLWKCFMMGFANIKPFGKVYRLDFGGARKERPFDAGVVCNKANLIEGDHQLISCTPIPTHESVQNDAGIIAISDFNYLQRPAVKASTAFPHDGIKQKGFYDFSDETIEAEYNWAIDNWDKSKYFV